MEERRKAQHEYMKFCEELQEWLEELESFQGQLYSGDVPRGELEPLRDKLIRSAPRFKRRVIALTGKQYREQLGRTFDIWDEALSQYIYDSYYLIGRTSLNALVDCVREALGVLESGEIPKHTTETELPEDSTQMANFLFDKMQFHPKVIEVSESLFKTKHYAQAIEEAFKAVDNFVQEKTGLAQYGKQLMAQAFDEQNPVIKLNNLKTRSDRDEQEGFKFLFMGAIVGIRNPKTHDNVVQTDPYRTLEYLGFASLLMKRAEEGELKRTRKKRPKLTKS